MENMNWFADNGIEVYTYVMPIIESNMYILFEKKERNVIIIDPHISTEAKKRLETLEFNSIIVLLTHEHYDHISGVNWLRENYEVTVICSKECNDNMKNSSSNFAKFWDIIIMGFNGEKSDEDVYPIERDYTCFGDVDFEGVYSFDWCNHNINLIKAPGHSIGGILIDIDKKVLFTGDNLTNGNGVIYRWPGGSKKDYLMITKPIIESYEKKTCIMPGHGATGMLDELMEYLAFYRKPQKL